MAELVYIGSAPNPKGQRMECLFWVWLLAGGALLFVNPWLGGGVLALLALATWPQDNSEGAADG